MECTLKFKTGHHTYYLQWDSQKGVPITKGMLLEDFKNWYRHTYGAHGMKQFDDVIKRARRTGSSWKGQSLEHIISVNRAGEPGNLSQTQIIRKFCPETTIAVRADRFPIHTKKCDYLFRTHEGMFDEGVRVLKSEHVPVITARDLAYCRAVCHFDANTSLAARDTAAKVNLGTWTDAFFLYYPNGEVVVSATNSPLVASAEEATKAHMNAHEYHVQPLFAKEMRARAESDPSKAVRSNALLLKRITSIAHRSLDDEPLGRFLFRDVSYVYGSEFLAKEAAKDMDVILCTARYAKAQGTPFARQLWIDTPLTGSALNAGSHPMREYHRRISGMKKLEK